jgi:CheY-like chemotaxis protein
MKTVLVLEDEPSLMMLMRHMLKGYNLLEAASADQALRLFSTHERQIDLLIADVTLPKGSGIQVALLLRVEDPGLPVILTSGYPVSAWSSRASADLERLGSKSVVVLPKPFQAQLLAKTVSELLARQSEKSKAV